MRVIACLASKVAKRTGVTGSLALGTVKGVKEKLVSTIINVGSPLLGCQCCIDPLYKQSVLKQSEMKEACSSEKALILYQKMPLRSYHP